MRGHRYEIELGGSRCADLTDKNCPRFISKAARSKGREGGEMTQGYTIVEYTAWLYRKCGVCYCYELL